MRRRHVLLAVVPVGVVLLGIHASAEVAAPPARPLFLNGGYALSKEEKASLAQKAISGDGKAALRLSKYYTYQDFDTHEKLYWLTISAEDGDPIGQYDLGFEFVREEDTKARGIYWLTRAKEQGVAAADDLLRSVTGVEKR